MEYYSMAVVSGEIFIAAVTLNAPATDILLTIYIIYCNVDNLRAKANVMNNDPSSSSSFIKSVCAMKFSEQYNVMIN